MRTCRLALIACLFAAGVSHAQTDVRDTHKKLLELQKTLQKLDWEKVDFDALRPVERCRTLLLLNHALDELSAVALAEDDLLGAFLEEQNLSAEYAAKAPAGAPPARTFEDARKIAAALLAGPMATSPYASDLADTDENGLKAYENMYDRTCRGKWEGFAVSSQDVRSMVAFLKAKGKLKEYMNWAPTETNRRQVQYEQEQAAQPAAPAPRPKAAGQEPQGQPAELEQQQKERTESEPAQEALYAMQQPPAAQTVVVDDDGWYSGWYYGAVDNLKRERAVHRDSGYQAQARARVEQRRDNWQGPARPSGVQPPARPRGGGGRRP